MERADTSMEFISPMLIAFGLVFLSELGDKTQLLVLSFSTKLKAFTILLGVALGSLLSHGIAILFGSMLGSTGNLPFQQALQFLTYCSFIVLGVLTIFSQGDDDSKPSKLGKISNLKINYVLVIAFTIAIGEIGDKTFLASLGLGIGYPEYKLSLIIGAILGMVVSDCIAIFLGKFLSKHVSPTTIQKFSGALFVLFGLFGLFFGR